MSSEMIKPVRKFSLELDCPPDKSITHRALILASVARGGSTVKNISLCADCMTTADCMRRLGADVRIEGDTAYVFGTDDLKSGEIYTGNSGTAMRLLTGLLAPRDGLWEISGDESLSRRPMDRVILPLSLMGGDIMSECGKAPLWIVGTDLKPITYELPVASAQVKSAILLAGLGTEGRTVIFEPVPTRDHTEIMLREMGADIRREGEKITLRGKAELEPIDLTVVGDMSSAAYPLVLGLITGGVVTVRGVGLNPMRTGILEIFDRVGADYDVTEEKTSGEKMGSVTVRGLVEARPFEIAGNDIPRLIDEIPVLAVLACFLKGDSVIAGAGELRTKESDRLGATVELIKKFGGDAEVRGDDLIVHSRVRLIGGCDFHPKGDHRMAMTAAVAAAASEKGGTLEGGECVSISYPGFWQMMNKGGAL